MEICSAASGTTLAVLEDVEGQTTKAVKQRLAINLGISRFRQRMLSTTYGNPFFVFWCRSVLGQITTTKLLILMQLQSFCSLYYYYYHHYYYYFLFFGKSNVRGSSWKMVPEKWRIPRLSLINIERFNSWSWISGRPTKNRIATWPWPYETTTWPPWKRCCEHRGIPIWRKFMKRCCTVQRGMGMWRSAAEIQENPWRIGWLCDNLWSSQMGRWRIRFSVTRSFKFQTEN